MFIIYSFFDFVVCDTVLRFRMPFSTVSSTPANVDCLYFSWRTSGTQIARGKIVWRSERIWKQKTHKKNVKNTNTLQQQMKNMKQTRTIAGMEYSEFIYCSLSHSFSYLYWRMCSSICCSTLLKSMCRINKCVYLHFSFRLLFHSLSLSLLLRSMPVGSLLSISFVLPHFFIYSHTVCLERRLFGKVPFDASQKWIIRS